MWLAFVFDVCISVRVFASSMFDLRLMHDLRFSSLVASVTICDRPSVLAIAVAMFSLVGCAGESIPVRLFLSPFDLSPTFKNIHGKFNVKYYLNLVLVDEEERRYFKQQARRHKKYVSPTSNSCKSKSRCFDFFFCFLLQEIQIYRKSIKTDESM